MTTSTCVIEYMIILFVTKEVTWLKQFLVDLKNHDQTNYYVQILFRIDNQNVKALVENSIHHNRTKHVDIVYHYIREKINEKRIQLEYISID